LIAAGNSWKSAKPRLGELWKGKWIRLVPLIMAFWLGPSLAFGDPGSSGKERPVSSEKTIIALGDSLTAGYGVKEKEAYPARLERKLREAGYRWRVINAGISGETSSETLARLNRVLALKPDMVILEIGVNDGFQGLDPTMIRRDIEEIVHSLKKHGVVVVLAGMRMFDNSRPGYNASFAAIYPEVAEKHDLVLIPFFLEGVAGDPSLNRLDGIHPTARGYRIVTETVYPFLLKADEQGKHP
jgi:acyl-CoA thioesterase I